MTRGALGSEIKLNTHQRSTFSFLIVVAPFIISPSIRVALHLGYCKRFKQKQTTAEMKLSMFTSIVLLSNASAFAPSMSTRTSTSLDLFGGKKDGGDKAAGSGPMGGMMDQLAMFKKAQEIAQKKKQLDDEIAKMEIIGSAADGKIKVTVQYIPAQMPTNPSPSYDATKIDIDEAYFESVSPSDLGTALVDAIRDGETAATKVVAEKYQSLDKELSSILGGLSGGMK